MGCCGVNNLGDVGSSGADFGVGGVKGTFETGVVGFGARPMAVRRILDLGVQTVGDKPMVGV